MLSNTIVKVCGADMVTDMMVIKMAFYGHSQSVQLLLSDANDTTCKTCSCIAGRLALLVTSTSEVILVNMNLNTCSTIKLVPS